MVHMLFILVSGVYRLNSRIITWVQISGQLYIHMRGGAIIFHEIDEHEQASSCKGNYMNMMASYNCFTSS